MGPSYSGSEVESDSDVCLPGDAAAQRSLTGTFCSLSEACVILRGPVTPDYACEVLTQPGQFDLTVSFHVYIYVTY